MKFIPLCFCFIFLSLFANAQVTWEKLFVQSSTDVFRSVQEVPAGGYVAAGYTSDWNNHDTDAFIVRLTTSGDTLWTRTIDGGKKDLFYKVINTSDGGFVTCGYSNSFSSQGDEDAWYLKLDANGNSVWSFTYGGSQKERAQDIIQTSDGGFAFCGYSNSGTGAQGYNAFLVKTDASGNQSWSMKYGTNAYEDANSVKELTNGDFILAGQQSPGSIGLADILLIRTDASGTQQWMQNVGSTDNDNAENIQLNGSAFIICGSTTVGGSDDGYLVKTNSSGVAQWSRNFGGSSPDDFHTVQVTSDGYILTGTTQSNAAIISNQWLFKTDSNGDSTWAYTFGGDNHDHAYSGIQTSDGGYLLCGYTASFGFNYEDALVIKVDQDGLLHNHLFYGTVTALVSPADGDCGSEESVVTIEVKNFGDTVLSTFNDSVTITGTINQVLGQVFTGNLSPFNSASHAFTTTINTSAGGTFHFHCATYTSNDVYPAMNSCDSTITLRQQPAFSLGSDTIHTNLSSYVLDAGSGYTSYQWSTGETTESITVNGISDSYCVEITGANNCPNSDCVYLDFSDGIEEADGTSGVTISPNPSTGNVTFTFSGNKKFNRFEVTDVTGRVLLSGNISGNTQNSVFINASRGIYFVLFSGASLQLQKRIIIE